MSSQRPKNRIRKQKIKDARKNKFHRAMHYKRLCRERW